MRGVRKRFGPTVALDGVDFAVCAGEVHALVGENGAGKSTLMKVLSGAERADGGSLRLDGVPFAPADPLDARRAGVAMIYQELSLAGHLTVEQNISLGMEPARLGVVRRGEARRRAREALAQLGRSDLRPDAPLLALPTAERQIVEIARAVATGCRVLVLDEPTSSLGREDVERLFALVRRLKAAGHAVVYISHFLEEVRQIADRFTVLRDGVSVGSGDASTTPVEEVVRQMIGRRIEQLYPRSPRPSGEEVLVLRDFAGMGKPGRVDLSLRRGEVLGVAGLLGAGRTELLRAIFGLDRVRRGEVRVGAWVGAADPHPRLSQGVGLLSEDRKGEGLALNLSVAENLTLSRLHGLGPSGFVFPGRAEAAAREWIRRLDIRCRGPWQTLSGLSGGNQQKVAFGRLLHHDVDVWLLDEPTRGVDVASKAEIYRAIDRLALGEPPDGRRPRAILMVSSYLPELLGVCDRIAVMHRGVLGPARRAAEWDEHSLLLAATG
jgi:ribose transport system ATP-binding protein